MVKIKFSHVPDQKIGKTYDTPEDDGRKRRDTNDGSGDLIAHLNVPSVTEEQCAEIGGCLRLVSFSKNYFMNRNTLR